MAGPFKVGGRGRSAGSAQFPPAFVASAGGIAKRGAVQDNPATFTTPGVHLYGVPAPGGSVVVEQWGQGAGGGAGTSVAGGVGGGSGSYAKYSLSGAMCPGGGVLTVTIAAVAGPGEDAGQTQVTSSGGVGMVVSQGAVSGGDGGVGGTNTVTPAAGLVVATDTAGGAGKANVTTTGGAGGSAPNGGAGGAGGTKGLTGVGLPGVAPGGGGGGGGADISGPLGGAGGGSKVVITWVPPA